MLDKIIYKFFESIDKFFSFIETYAVKLTSWLWQTRIKILNKKRGRNK